MSRHNYCDDDDLDPLQLGRWRGQVASAMRGRRGQKLLRDMLAALDAMPEKRLCQSALERDGEVCALGAVGRARGIDMAGIDPEDAERVAAVFDVPEALVCEITYENDEVAGWQNPEQRWKFMRAWADRRITKENP